MNKVFITGDIHGDTGRLYHIDASVGDYIIICGDFGLIWDYEGESLREKTELDSLADLDCTILFVDGNHENFDRLNAFPEEEWHGGKVHKIRDNVLHLMRGYIFDICGKNFFAMGGARCHDIKDGVYKCPEDIEKIRVLSNNPYSLFRIEGMNIWYDQEVPNEEERQRGLKNLEKVNNKVDYIITHEAPTNLLFRLYSTGTEKYDFTDYLEKIEGMIDYDMWYFGHHHINKKFDLRHQCLYERVVKCSC